MSTPEVIKRAKLVHSRLRRAIPKPICELRHDSAFQLLIATILSAQSTDARVNLVIPVLFAAYPTPAALAAAEVADVERIIKSTGFFRNKTKLIIGTSAKIVADFGGEVPRTLKQLTTLPGVARKTANVVLGVAYRVTSGITVDTHAGRVSRRLGLSEEVKADKVEKHLCALFPKRGWIDLGHRLVLHGRYVCKSQKPRCHECPLNSLCPSVEAKAPGPWGAHAAAQCGVFRELGVAEPAATS